MPAIVRPRKTSSETRRCCCSGIRNNPQITQIWSAPAQRSGDGAPNRYEEIQSGVAPDKSGLPPHSKFIVASAPEPSVASPNQTLRGSAVSKLLRIVASLHPSAGSCRARLKSSDRNEPGYCPTNTADFPPTIFYDNTFSKYQA